VTTFIVRRVLYSLVVLVLASVLVFVLVRKFGPDPTARLRQGTRDPQAVVRERERLHLDDSLATQYVRTMKEIVRFDWGDSFKTGRSVTVSIRAALWETVQLAFWGVLFSALVAIAVGVFSANKPYSARDYVFTGLAFAGLAMPTFWFGLLTIQFLAYELQQLFDWQQPLFYSAPIDTGGGPVEYFRHLALPVLTLSVQLIAGWSRYQRSSMLEVMGTDYIRTVRAKGLRRRQVVLKHGLRNSLSTLVTVMAVDVGALFAGLVVTEQIFSIPGMGKLFLESLLAGDTNVLIPWMLVTGAFVVSFNLVADVLYGLLDPRVRVA
jgi:peptide/nickel transport system permease protein